MQVLARCFVIHALYFVGRKTAIKLSTAKANTIPKETLNESRENEEPTLAIWSEAFRPRKVLYSKNAKIGATTVPVKKFAADIVNRNMDDVLRKDRRGSISTVTTRRPLPIAVTGDKIVLYTAKASSSCRLEVELEAAPLKPSLTLVKLNVFMKNSQCVAERYVMISVPLKPISSLHFCISLY